MAGGQGCAFGVAEPGFEIQTHLLAVPLGADVWEPKPPRLQCETMTSSPQRAALMLEPQSRLLLIQVAQSSGTSLGHGVG